MDAIILISKQDKCHANKNDNINNNCNANHCYFSFLCSEK